MEPTFSYLALQAFPCLGVASRDGDMRAAQNLNVIELRTCGSYTSFGEQFMRLIHFDSLLTLLCEGV